MSLTQVHLGVGFVAGAVATAATIWLALDQWMAHNCVQAAGVLVCGLHG